MATIEFSDGSPERIAVVAAMAVPRPGEIVSIRKRTYQVERVVWAVNDADREPSLRVTVEVRELYV